MHRRFAQALRSLAFKEGELPSDKPILLQSAEEHAEDQNHTETEDDSWILQEDLERIKPSKQQSNHRLLWLAVVTCLILFLVLLVSLLVLSRKIGHGCKCSEQNGPQHLEMKNTTSNSELLKYLQFLNETLKSTLNKRNDDLAELKSTVKRVTLSVENLHSAMKDVRAAMNGTKNDLAKLKRTVTTVENLHSAMKDVRAAVNGTKNDLAKLKRTVTTLELFNSSLNQVNSKLTRTSNDISKLYSTVTKLENYNSSLNEVKSKLDRSRIDLSELNSTVTKVKSTLDRRSKDVTDLKSTVTKVKSKSDRNSDDVSVLNCTVTKLDKAIQSNFSESCQNVTWNSAFEDCKLKSCCAANSREEIPLTAESCKELYNTNGSDANKAYRLRLGKNILPVYCHMTTLDGCGGGGWTLVMKMDGSKLNKANLSNLRMSCQNETWNAEHDECKHKSRSATNFSGKHEETPPAAKSCRELYNRNGSDGNKAYPLKLGKRIHPVYCHMTALNGCGGGGWTLVMKMDCSKNTFHYNQLIWSNKLKYNPFSGETGFDRRETMLPTYWETGFTRICLGMKNGKETNFIAINITASSLFSLIADGKYHPTSLGRDKWKSLLRSNASLQSNCTREGFNAFCAGGAFKSRARIGIIASQENHCHSCDSSIGFGTGGHRGHSNACGIVALGKSAEDDGHKNIKTMGFILVQ